MTRAGLSALLVVLLIAAGCGPDPEEIMHDQEEVARVARAEIDALADRLGTDPVVKQDTLTDCVPGDRSSGKSLIYIVHIKTPPGSLERLRTDIAAEYEEKGWRVEEDPEGVSFYKGAMSIGANVAEELGGASVMGSGGCVN